MMPPQDARVAGVMEGPRSAPPRHLLLGHLPAFRRDRLGFLSSCADPRRTVRLRLGRPTFLLNAPDDIKHVLVTNHRNYGKTARLTSGRGRRQSGQGLLTSGGDEHLRQRRMLQPAFRHEVVESFAEVAVREAERTVDGWEDRAHFDVAEAMMGMAQRIMLRILFSTARDDELTELASAISTRRRYLQRVFGSLVSLPEYLPLWLFPRYRAALRRIDRAIFDVIAVRRGTGDRPPDLLSLLLETSYQDGTAITDRQVRDEVFTLLLTGYETLGEALGWTVYLLSRNPHVEARLLAELAGVLRDERAATRHLPELRYAEMVLAESLRLYPPTWIIVRMATHADLLPSGTLVPAGAKLYLCQYVVHRNPAFYRDPDRFDPDRFGDEARSGRPRFAYFPFGAGPRVCIGESLARMNGVLVLATVLRRFRFDLLDGQVVAPEPGLTLSPRGGIGARVRRRD